MTEVIAMRQHEKHPRKTQHTGAEDGDDSGSHRLAHASHGCRRHLITGGNKLQCHDAVHAYASVIYHVRVRCEETQEESFIKDKHPVAHGTRQRRQCHAHPEDAVDAREFPRTIILTDECYGSAIECRYEEITVGLEVERGCRTCHGTITETVDGRLHHDIGKGEHHALQSCRHTYLEHRAEFLPVYAHIG